MTKKTILIFGIFAFSVLMMLALLFYKERTIFSDFAFYLFSLFKDQQFFIAHQRIGAAVIQILPLAAIKLGLSMNTVLMLYSLSFVLFYFLVFLFILLVQKNNRIALAYLIFNLIITTHTFYWIQSELPVAAAFLFLYIGLADNNLSAGKPYKYWFLSLILLAIVCFTHPLMIFGIAFCCVYFLLTYRKYAPVIFSSVAIFLCFFTLKTFLFTEDYDNKAMGGLDSFVSLFPHYWDIQSNKNFVDYLINDYYFLALFFAAVVIFYLLKKKYLKGLLVITFCVVYALILNITRFYGVDQFYIENQYLLLGLFVGIPLACELVPAIKSQIPVLAVFSVFLVLSLIRIYNGHSMYTTKLNWSRMILKTTEGLPVKKLMIRNENLPENILVPNWSSSYEFWLLSTIESGESRSIIIQERKDEFLDVLHEKKRFITKYGAFEYEILPKQYFKFNDTSAYCLYSIKK